jgi:nitrite reductase/ring-hydroxylating ferredoxin subunit
MPAPTESGVTGFVPVGKVSELAPGHMKWVAVDRERVVLVNVDGAFYALSDVCGHQRAPLSRGRLEGHVVECPVHFARFDVRTGHLVSGPVAEDVPVREVRVEGDVVFVKRRAPAGGGAARNVSG